MNNSTLSIKNISGRILKNIRSNIFYGIVLLVPVVASVFIIEKLFQWFDSWIYLVVPDALSSRIIPGMGIVVLLAVTYILGAVARNYLGKRFLKLGNALLHKIPLFNKIYGLLRQIIDTFAGQKHNKLDKVVLVKFPNDTMYSLAFITSHSNVAVSQATGKNLISVFLPNAPNPTSGFLLYVSEDDVLSTDISIETAFKLIMSGGVVTPDSTTTTDTSIHIKDINSFINLFKPPEKQTPDAH
jgi:uncharacterized membrane protein